VTPYRWLAGALGVVLLTGGLAACNQDEPPSAKRSSTPAPQSPTTSALASGSGEDYDQAESDPRQDPVYSRVGNPVVDALHYDLTLDWAGDSGVLTGTEELTFRAAEDSDTIPLDFSRAFTLSRVSLDGQDAGFEQKGADLVIKEAVQKDQEHVLTLEYAGTPRPAPAPTTRGDFSLVGWQSDTNNGTSYTMQEPYGAFTWYAVNDQPSDKAFYDIAITTPQDLTGVANGTLESNRTSNGKRTTRWHLDSPAASYLVTVATGRYAHLEAESKSGVPLQVWAPPDNEALNDRLVRMLT
jgi:aminopeptidase N